MDAVTKLRDAIKKLSVVPAPVQQPSASKSLEERVTELEKKVEPISELFDLAQPE